MLKSDAKHLNVTLISFRNKTDITDNSGNQNNTNQSVCSKFHKHRKDNDIANINICQGWRHVAIKHVNVILSPPSSAPTQISTSDQDTFNIIP